MSLKSDCALNKDDICDLHGQAPVLRHGQGRAPGHQLRTELWPEHIRAHPSEETQGERGTEWMTWSWQIKQDWKQDEVF